MRLLVRGPNHKSPMELAAIEATNNRRAVRELRRTLRLAASWMEAFPDDVFEREAENAASYCREKVKLTSPARIAGRAPSRRGAKSKEGR